MPLVENTNVASLLAQNSLTINTQAVQQSMERLASGLRINHAGDDAAGLTISQNMEGQLVRMQQNTRNTQDGTSILQVADGALSTISDDLQRVRELTVQAANDVNTTQSRNAIAEEVKALMTDIDRIANGTQFNGINLLNNNLVPDPASGQYAVKSQYFPIQIGPNSTSQTNVIDIASALQSVTTETNTVTLGAPPLTIPVGGLGIFDGLGKAGNGPGGGTTTFDQISDIDFSATSAALPTSNAIAQSFLTDIDSAISKVNAQRATVGSFENEMQSVNDNLSTSIENFSSSISSIRDDDVAAETANLTQHQILQQASVQVLAQSNQLPQMILGLLTANK